MKQKGVILMELLIATTLLSFAGNGLYAGLAHAVRIERTIQAADALYDPFKLLWIQVAKDLRNSVRLREYPFIGKQDEMAFPVLNNESELAYMHYFVKNGDLVRTETPLPKKFTGDFSRKEVILKDLETARFEYAYLNEEESLVFKRIWMEEPYFGIPRAVRVSFRSKKKSEKVFTRLFSIPQGRWGHE